MAFELAWLLLAVFAVSTVSFVGILAFAVNKSLLNNILFALTAFAAGTLLGASLLDLLPEALEASEGHLSVFVYVLIGLFVFYSIERFISWHHHHHREIKEELHREIHAFTYLSLIGDAVHNFIDGVIIAASFLTNIPLGVAATIAIALHEIPQEIGDFALLVYGGFSHRKAVIFNFISALAAVLGGILGFFFLDAFGGMTTFLLAFAAGGFIYVSTADLIPELHKERGLLRSIIQFLCMVGGVALIYAIITISHG